MSQITGTLIQRKVLNNHIYCMIQTDIENVQRNHIVYFDVRDTQTALAIAKYPMSTSISVKGRIVYRYMKDPRFRRGKLSLFEAQEIVNEKPVPVIRPLIKYACTFFFITLLACIPTR